MKNFLIVLINIVSLEAAAQFLALAPTAPTINPKDELMAKLMHNVFPGANNTVNAKVYEASAAAAAVSVRHTLRSTEVEVTANPIQKVAVAPLAFNLKPTEKMSSPELVQVDLKKLSALPTEMPKTFVKGRIGPAVPPVQALVAVPAPTIEEPYSEIKELIPMKVSDYKILEALIYLDEHKNYGQAMALLAEVMKGQDYKYEALFAYALTAQALNLNSEFRYNMFRVAKDSKDEQLKLEATEALVQFVEALEISDMKDLEPLVAKYSIDTTNNDAYNFYRAKYNLEEGRLSQVEDALLFVSEKSKYYGDALLVSALYNYRRGQIDDTIFDLGRLSKVIGKYDRLQGIAALTLARAYFQKGLYKEASTAYLKVNKADPLWLQAMVEQAWTQILIQDYEGAAGNMFTLHTEYFKNAFAPDSYLVRTVGYLNLCQFGDGLQVLNNLNRKYGPLKQRLSQYRSNNKENINYYDTVKKWFKDPKQSEVDGLPRALIMEVARHPNFMKIQTHINHYEDELEIFTKATLDIIHREKILIKKQTEAKDQIAKIQKLLKDGKSSISNLKVDLIQQERKLAAYKMQYQLTNRARGLIKDLREKAVARIEIEKRGLRDKAGKALKDRFNTILADLNRILDQNDVLQYELYSGAGEHLRYQMAGGGTKDSQGRKPASEKHVSWKFQGEIWEDEVGHVKSSLQNVCPKDEKNVASTH